MSLLEPLVDLNCGSKFNSFKNQTDVKTLEGPWKHVNYVLFNIAYNIICNEQYR